MSLLLPGGVAAPAGVGAEEEMDKWEAGRLANSSTAPQRAGRGPSFLFLMAVGTSLAVIVLTVIWYFFIRL
ncbi:MAG TPA: hypothetical protein VNZ94_19615 [Xanthobacteraceae bacterium]|nr:hypothetical protein [Xanthobacteraceae bacterium]